MSVTTKRLLWTFVVKGGDSFILQPKGNIPEEHEGGRSVMQFVLTEKEAEDTRAVIASHGCMVEMTVVRQTEEQQRERRQLNTVQDKVVPSAKCPECVFFDPFETYGSLCGWDSWPIESVKSLFESFQKAREDLEACPLEKSWDTRSS